MQALNKKMAQDLWHTRGQVFAIALVIAAAVATTVLSSGTYRSLEMTQQDYYTQYRFAHVFAALKRAPDDLKPKIKHIPGVLRVDSRIRQYALLDMPDIIEPVRGLFISLPVQVQDGLNIPVLRSGSWPRPEAPDEILVHEAFAEAHKLHPGDRVRATINGRQRQLMVAGIALSPEFVYALGPGDLVPDGLRFGVFWMGRKALAAAGNLDGAFNDVALQLEKTASPVEVIAALDVILDRYGGTGAYERKDQTSHAFVDSELNQLKTMTRIIPPIFLITALFLLNIAMGRLIDTEREQIGLLKAIGYSGGQVGWHYLKTALVIAVLGILAGWLAGIWLGHSMVRLYIEYFRFPVLRYQVTAGVFLGAAAVSLAAAGAGAFFAIRRAIELPPAVAMVPPPPPVYRAAAWERAGLLRGLSPGGQMVVRHLARWPLRSTLTVTGISLSVALLLLTLYFFDSIDTMMDSFFYQNNRQDITISFTEPRNDSAAAELAHFPGVLRVELQRNVEAKLESGPRTRRIAIVGLDPGAELSRHVDADGAVVELPFAGIIVNEKLAELLGVDAGGILHARIMEGRRPERSIAVTGLTREYIGTTAYMNRDALNRLLHEGPVANAALLSIDRAQLAAFYKKAKEAPFIAGISSQAAAVALFRKLIRENILVMVTFYILFASILAFGVIYNNVRLTVAERGREFALLRVLGFRQGEVAAILANEVALLTLAALLPGCLVGYGLIALMVSFFSTDLYRLPFVVEPSTYGYAVIAILIAAAISGIVAAWRLAELDLLGVLKARE